MFLYLDLVRFISWGVFLSKHEVFVWVLPWKLNLFLKMLSAE